MYQTCLFCASRLGINETLEAFPVGRRIAFDAFKGRLWVVCLTCAQWNLAPLEERWEAVEACERLFRATRLRASTDNVGLARHASGLEFVRVGRPMRPELAAWRYGPRLTRRRRRYLLWTGAGLAAGGAGLLAGVAAGALSLFAARVLWGAGSGLITVARSQRIVARTLTPYRVPVAIRERDLPTARLVRQDHVLEGWALRLDHPGVTVELTGAEALRVAGLVLARVNGSGARPDQVRAAAERLDRVGDVSRAFAQAAGPRGGPEGLMLSTLIEEERLALEMAAHDESERRAMEGELRGLEAAWREAEEIASIADNLLLPPRVHAILAGRKPK